MRRWYAIIFGALICLLLVGCDKSENKEKKSFQERADIVQSTKNERRIFLIDRTVGVKGQSFCFLNGGINIMKYRT